MRIITISREFGSGGRELGKRLAEELGFDYYDREIISAISQNQGLDEKYVENTLENQGWRDIPIVYRQSFTSYLAINNSKINILVEQKKVIEKIASLNKDFVIVGQNADIILSEYKPFNIFVCASMESKIKRCEERANENERLTRKEIEKITNFKPQYAVVIINGEEIKVAPSEVKVGETIIIKPGENVPIDCEIIQGQTNLNTQSLTGESLPVFAEVGDKVLSGSIVMDGAIVAKTTTLYKDSTVSKILNLIENNQQKKVCSSYAIYCIAFSNNRLCLL